MQTKISKNWLDKLSPNQLRLAMNWWPPLLGSGISIKKVSHDYRYVEVNLKLTFYNKNYVGTHFGGSMFSMTDPFYMLMLLKNLGNDFIVWDKVSTIAFKKPGRGVLRAVFELSEEEIRAVRDEAEKNGKCYFDRSVDIKNEADEVVATVKKTLYVKYKLHE